MTERKRLGEMLLEAGLISEFQLKAALSDQRNWGIRLGTSLTRLGYLTESQLTNYLSIQYGIPGVDLDKIVPEAEALRTLAPETARQHLALPISIRKGAGGASVLRVAVGDPSNLESVDEIKFVTNHPVEAVIASDHAIERAIDRYYFGKEDPADHVTSSLAVESEENDRGMVIVRGNIEEVIETDRPPSTKRPSAPVRRRGRPAARAAGKGRGGSSPEEAVQLVKALARLLIRRNLITREDLQKEIWRK
jgi:type IV pilus assembly protein PilB